MGTETNTKPATALPWGLSEQWPEGFGIRGQRAQVVKGAKREDADYIVAACNAYPELVAEVKELLRNMTYGDGIASGLTQDCEALEALLRKLGE